jgi:hypothetical protein
MVMFLQDVPFERDFVCGSALAVQEQFIRIPIVV